MQTGNINTVKSIDLTKQLWAALMNPYNEMKQPREIEVDIDYPFDWSYSVSVEQMKKDIEELEKLGATHMNISAETFYDDAYLKINPVCIRMENEQEVADRIKKEENEKAIEISRDRAMYEKLKAKFKD